MVSAERDRVLTDFEIDLNQGVLELRPGPELPDSAREYLRDYLRKTVRYHNISDSPDRLRFSLYQPPLPGGPGKRALVHRLQRKFGRKRLPAAATIGVTSSCQCSCLHCSADYHMGDPAADLSTGRIIQAIAEAVELGVTSVILLGGEPLLHGDLEAIIESVDRERAVVTLFTNGEHLDLERCQALGRAGLSGIFVSVDAPAAGVHDNGRGRPGLFAKLSGGVRNARECGLPVALSGYLTSDKLRRGEFERMMQLGRELGVNEVTFFDAIAVGRRIGEEPTALTEHDRRRIAELTRRYRRDPAFPTVTPQSVLTSAGGSSFCFAANTQFYLSSSGQFCPCDFTPLTIGRYPEKSIAGLWDELITCELYRKRSKVCRMQDPDFRKKSIDLIPAGAILPYPIQLLERSPRTRPERAARLRVVAAKTQGIIPTIR